MIVVFGAIKDKPHTHQGVLKVSFNNIYSSFNYLLYIEKGL
jgi:hypothetical protein